MALNWKRAAKVLWRRVGVMTRLYESWSERADKFRDENERLKAEIKEARNEAATVRRAYLHEKNRADRIVQDMRRLAEEGERHAYKSYG